MVMKSWTLGVVLHTHIIDGALYCDVKANGFKDLSRRSSNLFHHHSFLFVDLKNNIINSLFMRVLNTQPARGSKTQAFDG